MIPGEQKEALSTTDIQKLYTIIAQLHKTNSLLTEEIGLLREKISLFTEECAQLRREIIVITEENNMLKQKLFGRTSEKQKHIDEGPGLFNEAEAESEPSKSSEQEETETITYTRAKGHRGRKPISDSLPREEIVILPKETICPFCGEPLERLPESCDDITEKLEYKPPSLKVRREIRPKFRCRKCQGNNSGKSVIYEAAATPSVMPGSIATPELLAAIIVAKFQQGMPLYRLERYFGGKAKISRQTMSNWIIGVAKALKPLDDLILAEIRAGPVQRHDETRVEVVTSRDGKGRNGIMQRAWMWVALGGCNSRRAVRFKYSDTRGHTTVEEYLSDYKGYFQTDGYSAYDCVLRAYPDVKHVGCFAHARRRFVDAEKNSAQKKSAAIALKYIQELYVIESELRKKLEENDISAEDFLQERKEQAKPVLAKFRMWLDKRLVETMTDSLLERAIGYASNQWSKLITYLDCIDLTPDNNLSENAIRPFVIGRKNWLFFQCEAGAQSAAQLYSLIETAKLNGVEPLAYLTRVIELAPTTSDWSSLLPWNLKLPDGRI